MRERSVTLTDELDQFITGQVNSGQYADASDVMRAALRTLDREEREHQAKLAALEAAITSGDSSGIFDGDAFASVREQLGWEPRA